MPVGFDALILGCFETLGAVGERVIVCNLLGKLGIEWHSCCWRIGIAMAIMSAQMVISVPRLPCSTLNSRHGTHQLATVSNSFQSMSLWLPSVGYLRGSTCQLRERDSAGRAVKSTFTPYTEEIDSERTTGAEEEASTSELLCCPICFQPLSRKGPGGLNRLATHRWYLDEKPCGMSTTSSRSKSSATSGRFAIKRSGFSCPRCKRGYSNRDVYLDLTVLGDSQEYNEVYTPGIEVFRNPLVSFVYERGWRQSFYRAGFPGPDEEFKMAQDYLKPQKGGVLLDVSCGSGLFTRRFVKSGDYKAVIALDFSESMLRQTSEFIKSDSSLSTSDIALVRADVARLPFGTGTIDAVHAGAALHCWPSPAAGMAEISRILKPGGVFVATTFLSPIPYFGNNDIRKVLKTATRTSTIRYWDEIELKELCATCGLVDYSQIQRSNFIMVSARKSP